jgi:hypothetical protein
MDHRAVYGIKSYGSLVQECAWEIFAHFMLALTSNISQVKGITGTRERPNESAIQGEFPPIKTNSVFQMIASEVIQSGLVGTTAEAFNLIIPAFAKFGLLPSIEEGPPPSIQIPTPRRRRLFTNEPSFFQSVKLYPSNRPPVLDL